MTFFEGGAWRQLILGKVYLLHDTSCSRLVMAVFSLTNASSVLAILLLANVVIEARSFLRADPYEDYDYYADENSSNSSNYTSLPLVK